LNNLNIKIWLNTEQISFCKQNIEGFEVDKWTFSVAGNAGSDRTFIRLTHRENSKNSNILVKWNCEDEDWDRFLIINKEFSAFKPILPEIYSTDEKCGLILEEDCGVETIHFLCNKKNNAPYIIEIYKKIIDSLIFWHTIPLKDKSVIAKRRLDKAMLLWETDYFALHCVNEYFNLEKLLTEKWEQERYALAADVSALPLVCIHRDFQSENVLLHNNIIKFVDYQGARLGPAEYDVASLLFDPYASYLTSQMRYSLFDYYRKQRGITLSRHSFHIAAIQRLAQALGAYGNLYLHKEKLRYKEFIPSALRLLLNILETEEEYPEFRYIVGQCLENVNAT
jgi:aminoglycoside/choline kinase family phosphotransferase